MRRWPLAAQIAAALLLKFFLLYLLWLAFFSHPQAHRMRLPTAAVERQLLHSPPPVKADHDTPR